MRKEVKLKWEQWPWVNTVPFSVLQDPHQKYYITKHEERGFSDSLLRWNMIILSILTNSFTHFPSKGLENIRWRWRLTKLWRKSAVLGDTSSFCWSFAMWRNGSGEAGPCLLLRSPQQSRLGDVWTTVPYATWTVASIQATTTTKTAVTCRGNTGNLRTTSLLSSPR